MTEKLRAVAYVRVSTAKQADEGLSLAEQQRQVGPFIDGKGWEHVETFVEAGVSGSVPFDERPKFKLLLEQLPHIDRIVIPKLDRLGRSTKDLLHLFDRVEEAGVAIVSMSESIDTSTPMGRLTRSILAAIAEFERDRLSERVAEVTEARAREGGWHGGPRPFGYEYVRDDKGEANGDGLIVLEHEAAIVRRIFSEYVAGKSQRQITRDLNTDGIRPKNSDEWVQGTISKLLANPVYSGSMRLNGETYDGVHEAIVDAETWRKVEQLRLATARSDGGRGRTPTANHVLAGGLLRCGCGSAMGAVTKPTRTPGVRYEVYECRGRAQHGIDYCPQLPVKRRPIDEAVWRFFAKVALDVDATKAALAEQHDARVSEIDALRAQANREAQKTAEALTRIERDYRDGKLTAEQFTRLDGNLTNEVRAAEAQVARLNQQRETLADDMRQIDAETAVLEQIAALRAAVIGEVRAGGREGIDAFRAALRRLFSGFDLLSNAHPFGSGVRHDESVGWPHDDLNVGSGAEVLTLYPRIRKEAVQGWGHEDFPALRKAALSLSGTDADSFAT